VLRDPLAAQSLTIAMDCLPSDTATIRTLLLDELRLIAREGLKPDELPRVHAQLRRAHEASVLDNLWWAERLVEAQHHGENRVQSIGSEDPIRGITADTLRRALRETLDRGSPSSVQLGSF